MIKPTTSNTKYIRYIPYSWPTYQLAFFVIFVVTYGIFDSSIGPEKKPTVWNEPYMFIVSFQVDACNLVERTIYEPSPPFSP